MEEEVRIIPEHLSKFVVNELMNEFVDEICDEEELLRQKELSIKKILEGDDLMEKVEVEQLLAKLEDQELNDQEQTGIAMNQLSKNNPDCAKSN